MKNLILSTAVFCSIQAFAQLSAAAPVVLNCKDLSGNGTMTLTIQGDSSNDTISAVINESKTGLSYSEDGTFKDFENHGVDAVYTVSGGESETLVTESLINGAAVKGAVTRHIIGFAGGPGEAGWPDQTLGYSCSR